MKPLMQPIRLLALTLLVLARGAASSLAQEVSIPDPGGAARQQPAPP